MTQHRTIASVASPLLLTLFFALFTPEVEATRQHYIHWNSSNPIFRIDNTDHIIDVNVGNHPLEFDMANLICPKYSAAEQHSGREMEKFVIYSVSKEEYETCRITSSNPRKIAVCDRPGKLMYVSISFRSFSPTPGGMEFKPGHDYYFISTSADGDLWRRSGGKCSSHNMRLVFKVADNSEPPPTVDDEVLGRNPDYNGDYVYRPPPLEEEEDLQGNGLEDSSSSYSGRGQRDFQSRRGGGGGGGVIKQEASRMQESSYSSASAFGTEKATLLLLLLLPLLLRR